MGNSSNLILFLPCILHLLLLFSPAVALPLYTNSRWIVDESGKRVKLACLSWVSHLEVMVAEGLSKQPVDFISKKIADNGFNCVRLTWPIFLVTNDSLASLTVRQSFQNIGLVEAIAGLKVNNPSIVDLTLIEAYQAVVSSLGRNNVMVILDNHVSKPGWCCSSLDGNGFFGDQYFDPDIWLKGLSSMATIFKGTQNVVGMSLRNELRGPKENINDWYRYMQKGAEAVHSANPDVLVIVSGLSYGKDLSFLSEAPVKLTFTGKLVFEVHWYGFSNQTAWETANANVVCGEIVKNLIRRAGFLLNFNQGYPLFLSEFGVDQSYNRDFESKYLNCLLGVAAESDWDWALWTVVGSYYLREGVIEYDETYGLLNLEWSNTRNSYFMKKITALQSPFQGPGLSEVHPHKIIFHPLTGLCVQRKSILEPLHLGPCSVSDSWSYSPQKTLEIKGTYFCVQAEGVGYPAKLSIACSGSNSRWEVISESKMHLSSKLKNGSLVCLDVDSNNNIVTNTCKCLEQDVCDPGSQWFKLVDSTRGTGSRRSSVDIK